MSQPLLFYALSLLAIVGAVGLLMFKHPMNAAMSFAVTLIALAGLYGLLSATLVFAIQLIVYAGAIMSLILFIIMFLNIQPDDLPDESGYWYYLAGGAAALTPLALLLLYGINSLSVTSTPEAPPGFGTIKEVGVVLFTDWLLPFEIVSILLLVALVGAVVLAGKREGGND
ncbi:MAG TPA: NADH-quinone oxidoreductase subunit J [Desulfofustis sp.]|jgi:NADH-quinone oxidoreductase subunit J|nr:NADH-quinone oxidoreductase subunit J [Desulfofustis sp. PB-SRB1]HBH27909.1 NADH-quinone oxidoreductase subunit J [Desulfofustis sp.]HBH31251.1 NADH-quinone oxidoreductase subunit J [Desulfofustis sp.]